MLIIHNKYQLSGGEFTAVEAQINLLRQHGHQVLQYHKDNMEIEEYGFLQKLNFFPNTIFSRRTYQDILEIVNNEQPDLAHVHNVFPLISPSVYYALKDCGIPIVQTVHNFRFMCPNGLFYTQGQICERCKLGNTLHAIKWKCYRESYALSTLYALSIGWNRFRKAFQNIDRFVALTDFVAEKLVESGLASQQQVTTLGNFFFSPLPFPGSFKEREPYILYLGRLSSEKGVDLLLKAVASIPRLSLKIAGDGPLASLLHGLANQLSLTHVEFLGRVEGEQKWDLLRNALALVSPSVCYETFGFAALESLSVGTPVIVPDAGSLPYLVESNKSGLLFSIGDVESLKEKLRWVSSNPNEMLAMGKYGRQVVEDRYSDDAHYKRLMQVYSTVVKAR